MRLVFVDKFPPTAPVNGRSRRLFGLSTACARSGIDTTTLTFGPRDSVRSISGVRTITVYAIAHPLLQATIGAWQLYAALMRLERNKGRFHVIQISNPQLLVLGLLLWIQGRSFSYEAQVIQSDFWKFSETPSLVWRCLGFIHEKAESWLAVHAVRVVVLSELDAKRAAEIWPQKRHNVVVIPHRIDREWLSPISTLGNGKVVVFVGSYNHFANREAVRFIVNELAPSLEKQSPQARLRLIGSLMPRDSMQRPNVEVISDAPDVRSFIDEAAICIAPIFQGSGVRIKVLEYMARGKAVVATRVGMSGIECISGRDYCQAESATDFADAIAMLLTSAAERVRLGRAARDLIERYYSWDSHLDELPGFLRTQGQTDE